MLDRFTSLLPRCRIARVYANALLGFAVVCSIVTAGVWWGLSRSYDKEVALAYAHADNAARLLAEQTNQTFERAEQVTALVKYLASHKTTEDVSLLAGNVLPLESSLHSQVSLVDADGRVRDSTHLARGQQLRDAEELQAVRAAQPDDPSIGRPFLDAESGRWMTPVAWRIDDGRDGDARAVLVSLDAQPLTQHVQFDLNPDAVIGLIGADGIFRARQAPAGFSAGQAWPGLTSFLAMNASQPMTAIVSPVDGVARFVAFSPVGKSGLHAMVGIPETQALAAWRSQRDRVVVVTCAALLLVGLLGWKFTSQTLALGRAVDRRRKTEKEHMKEKELLKVTLHSIVDAVVTTDVRGLVTYLNPRAEELTGWSLANAVGQPASTVVHVTESPSSRTRLDLVHRTLSADAAVELRADGLIVSRRGAARAIEHAVAPIYSLGGELEGAVMVLHDVSDAKKLAQDLSHQATHDALTGLPNRVAFDAALEGALNCVREHGHHHVLMFLDLDQFKVVNDSCGHTAGDELLRQLTLVLSRVIRKGDTLARLGGDEFAVLLRDCPLPAALRVAENLRETVADFKYAWQDRTFQVGASIGVVHFDDLLHTRTDLLRMADTACYIAKDAGRNRVHVFDESDEVVSQRQGELNWASKLQRALTEDRFVLHGQRLRALAPGVKIDTFEILVRLRDEEGRIVPPMSFIPAAERYGLMPAIDRVVIDKALALHARIAASYPHGLRFGINLSGGSLTDAGLVDYVAGKLQQHGVAATNICFEVTETAAISNLKVAVQVMTALRDLGCKMALDDFGSGMSSFGYLRQLPVDSVKIDGAFVRNMTNDPVNFAMVEAIQRIAMRMGLKTVAEFVESPETVEALRALGVDYVQGYGVEKPRCLLPVAAPTPAPAAASTAPLAVRGPHVRSTGKLPVAARAAAIASQMGPRLNLGTAGA
jgi:diguanylate cyclase (GGDEF)-like protein/PAS domain S-box-containing protein